MAVKARARHNTTLPIDPIARRMAFPLRPWMGIPLALVLLALLATRWLPRYSAPTGPIASFFTPEVRHWTNDIVRWANKHGVDANLLATVMQIESCGHPTISSYAGAQGLFQVMPFHFTSDENQLDPDTNARRGAGVLQQCSVFARGDVGLTMACYNGGPSVTQKPYARWNDQTQRYLVWGIGIYADAVTNQPRSSMLDAWLNAGGRRLCALASTSLGL